MSLTVKRVANRSQQESSMDGHYDYALCTGSFQPHATCTSCSHKTTNNFVRANSAEDGLLDT